MNEAELDIESFLAGQDFGLGTVPLAPIGRANRALFRELERYDALRTASTFAGLLTVPELQSNTLRIEILAHLALAACRGSRKPNANLLKRLFAQVGKGTAGLLEDPAEDVFVSNISTQRGNFRILAGLWESAGFYVQRIVDLLERLPQGKHYDLLRDSVYALLQLSDFLCERAALRRHQLGEDVPLECLPKRLAESARDMQGLVSFSRGELAERGISLDQFAIFSFDSARRGSLAADSIGHSALERYPLAFHGDKLLFILPTATSAAIRRLVVEQMDALNLRESFVQALALDYGKLFSDTPFLGEKSSAQVNFQRTPSGLFAGVLTRIDAGLYLNVVFFVDALEGFETDGLAGRSPDATASAPDLDRWIDRACEASCKQPDFRRGLTLIVGCGIGRSIVNPAAELERPQWRVEFVSASDFLTLSWLPNFKPLSLFRLLDAEDKVRELGVRLENINGLLNLVAWARSLDGHLLPHAQLPDDFGQGAAANSIWIDQNGLRKVRHDAVVHLDPHVIQDGSRRWIKVRKEGQSYFAENNNQPFFFADERGQTRWPRCVYESPERAWWVELETADNATAHWAYERSKMLRTWLCRSVPIIESAFPSLPEGPITWRARFSDELGDLAGSRRERFASFEDARAAITVTSGQGLIETIAGTEFELAIFHPENLAERALVASLVDACAAMSKATLEREGRDVLVQQIAPDPAARQSHGILTRNFRDYVRGSLPDTPMTIDSEDGALVRLGLGWQVRRREEGAEIRGKEECMVFLNAIVRFLEDDVIADLRKLDRRGVILFALTNHESAVADRDNWHRTAAAVLALHDDKNATLQTMAEHDFKLNGVFQSSRLLIEFAICECPSEGGRKAGRLELSRIMAKLMMIPGMGGWSDAIRWEAMEPRIRITPLGDIHANTEFYEGVIAPYGRVASDLRVKESVESYAQNFEDREVPPIDGAVWPDEFWEAWQEEFGASFDETRNFIDSVENLGLKAERAVVVLKRSDLLDSAAERELIRTEALSSLIDYFTFRTRPDWRRVPDGYDEKDRFPWRFRRRLSALRKPLLQIDDAPDPTIIVAPGQLRDALG